jgi:hypothetical protein
LTTGGIFDPVTICRAFSLRTSIRKTAKGRRRGSNSAPRLRRIYPLVMTNSLLLKMAIDGGFSMIFPLKMVIFHSYVSLPEGKCSHVGSLWTKNGIEQVT